MVVNWGEGDFMARRMLSWYFSMYPKPLIVIDTAIIGGPGRGLFQLVKRFQENSVGYLLTIFKYHRPKSNEFAAEAVKNNVNLAELRQRFRFDPSPIWELWKLARQGKYNLIQSHGYKSHLVAAVVARLSGMPWVAFAHGWTAENRMVALYHKLDRILLRYATVVVAVSPQLMEIFSGLRGPHKRTELILNAVDRNAIAGKNDGETIRREYGVGKEGVLIGCFGRLSFEKGQDILLRAFARILQNFPQCQLIVLGDGPSRSELEKIARELKIEEKIHFKAHDNQILDYYHAIDLLVLPSRSEGLPNVLLEAMSFSVPVISSDVGAVSEVIRHGENGLIVPPSDEEALCRCLANALSNRTRLKEIGKAGAESLMPKFCPKVRSQKILNLYKEICAKAE